MSAANAVHAQDQEPRSAAVVGGQSQDDDEEPSVESAFAGQPPPPLWQQVTVRSVAASILLGAVLSFISMRIGLTAGIGPSFNMAASLLGYFLIKSWTRLVGRCGLASQPFTRQENVVIQTCIISCNTLSFYGGFTSYLLAMTSTVAKSAGGEGTGKNVYELHTGMTIVFLLLTCFASLFCAMPLRKIMIVDYKLTFPTGSAIAGILNSFHTPAGAAMAKLQMLALSKTLVASFFWAGFQWFYTAGDGCGFQAFPLFGLAAYRNRFYFDFSPSLVGVGMICPALINFSMLFGSILSSFVIWPILEGKQGKWYTDPSKSSFRGINGYKVPMGVSLVLGDCLYQLTTIVIKATHHYTKNRQNHKIVSKEKSDDDEPPASYDERRRNQMFLNDGLPDYLAAAGYIVVAIVSIIFVPHIFPQLRYYHVAFSYVIAPIVAFGNSYGAGLSDWSLATIYGKLAIFIVGAWVGEAAGGAIAGLAACGIMLVIIGNSSDLMHDFKTGYLTLTSPMSMFVSQVIGTLIGCFVNPIVFLSFQRFVGKEHLGEAGSPFSAPMAIAYRGIASLSVEGVKTLPKHSAELCVASFLVALLLDGLTDIARSMKWKVKGYIPNPMAIALPFFVGPTISIDMCLGSLILILWRRKNKQNASIFSTVVASGLICGDGFWALPSSILSIFNVQPPICMKFLSSYQTDQMQLHFNLTSSS